MIFNQMIIQKVLFIMCTKVIIADSDLSELWLDIFFGKVEL